MSETIRNKATDYLARREYSRLELRQKLLAENFDAAEVDAVLDDLVASHLQDDARFAENYVRLRKQNGYGPERIAGELRQRGISSELITKAVDANSVSWRRQMASLLERRFTDSAHDNYQEKMRLLTNRGYSHEEIVRFLNQEGSAIDE